VSEIARFFGIVITMYANEHRPPHLHARYAGEIAKINLYTAEVMLGRLPRTHLKLVRKWIDLHREELLSNWDLLEQQLNPIKVEPLK
jgi:hypothetical protein